MLKMKRVLILGLEILTALGFVRGLHVTTHVLVLRQSSGVAVYREWIDGSPAASYTAGRWLIIGVVSAMMLFGVLSYCVTTWLFERRDRRAGKREVIPTFRQAVHIYREQHGAM
jgi:hypothetical protein